MPARKEKKRRTRGSGALFQRKDGVWVGKLTVGRTPDGKRNVAVVYGHTATEARQKLKDLQAAAAKGEPVKLDRITVKEHLEDWLAAKKVQVKSGTYLKYESHVLTHLIPALGHLLLRDLDWRPINTMYAALEEKHLAQRTIFDVASILRQALEDAVTKGLLAKNPAKLAASRRPGRKESRFMAPEEIRWLLAGAEGERLEAGFILALHTGMRPGEWLGLPWDAVDLVHGTVTIRQALHEEKGRVFLGDVKTKAARRTITLPAPAVDALLAHTKQQRIEKTVAGSAWQDTGLVFTTATGGLLRRSNVDGRDLARVIRKARKLAADTYAKGDMAEQEAKKAAGKLLEGVTLHTFRHTHASLLIAAGVDILAVSRRLGHENVRITLDLYGHLLPGQDERAAAAMTRFAESLRS